MSVSLTTITFLVLFPGILSIDDLDDVRKDISLLKSKFEDSKHKIKQLEGRLELAERCNIELQKRFASCQSASERDRRLEFSPTEIAFSTRLSRTLSGLKPHSTVVFNEVITDTSSSYGNTTGVFTVPVTGVYVFAWSTAVKQYEMTELIVDGAANGYARADTANDGDPDYGSASQIVVLKVNKNQHVWIQARSGSGYIDGYNDNTFSGWILYPLE